MSEPTRFNTEITVHPRLQHIGMTTGNLEPLLAWYETVLGMRPMHTSEDPAGLRSQGLEIRAVWLSNDEQNHRMAVIEIPGLTPDTERAGHHRLQHLAFEYSTLDELLGTYVRLRREDILPVLAVDEGLQTAFYYADPDQNIIEINVNNYDDPFTAIEHMRSSTDFARKPLGVDVDPELMVAAREAGASAWQVHKRAWGDEFAPARPWDPTVLL
ncbi:VOC family protein [Nocardiopsis synnemataformans]|uniref:VOC family protein n=1 Tax=Nocardiopsis synnemataformans TaxID=61305 RepID=UPI003EBC2F80